MLFLLLQHAEIGNAPITPSTGLRALTFCVSALYYQTKNPVRANLEDICPGRWGPNPSLCRHLQHNDLTFELRNAYVTEYVFMWM